MHVIVPNTNCRKGRKRAKHVLALTRHLQVDDWMHGSAWFIFGLGLSAANVHKFWGFQGAVRGHIVEPLGHGEV